MRLALAPGKPSDRAPRLRSTMRVFGAALASAALALCGVAFVSTQAGAGTRWAAAAAAPVAAVKEYTLEAREAEWEIMPGTKVRAWTYNGQVPGPEIRATEGDTIRVTLKNSLPVPTTIHWHGIDVPNAMDGVPGLTQNAVQPGETFTYEFTATNPGTRWYHPHQDPEVQMPLGLYGPLIIEPRTPEPTHYDREYTYMLSEWSFALTPEVGRGDASLPQAGPGATHSKELDFDVFMMNGKAQDAIPPVAVAQGERIRVRLINAGALMHVMHTHGHSFKVVATDGNPVPPAAQVIKDSVTIGPSERVDIELETNNPGIWMFHCHLQHHAANGMMTTIRYEGVAPPIQGGAHDHGGAAVPPSPPPAANVPVPTPIAAPPGQAAATGSRVDMVDNRFRPAGLTVPVGTTVLWANQGSNLHTASSLDGIFESGTLQRGQAFSYTFTKPGTYRYICRQHFTTGMVGSVTVTP